MTPQRDSTRHSTSTTTSKRRTPSVRLVLSGPKRATAGLLWTHELNQQAPSQVGALSVVTDWHGTPLCVIETTHIEIVLFDAVSDNFAATEGEGDQTLSCLAGRTLAIFLLGMPAPRPGSRVWTCP